MDCLINKYSDFGLDIIMQYYQIPKRKMIAFRYEHKEYVKNCKGIVMILAIYVNTILI